VDICSYVQHYDLASVWPGWP